MNKNFKYMILLFVSLLMFSNEISAKTAPGFDCSNIAREEASFTEEMFCYSELIQELVPVMNDVYSKFYETLSSKEQKILEESQINWLNNIKHQGFSELNSYQRREFYFIQHYQNRINLLKDAMIDKGRWAEYLEDREKNSQDKVRYLEKVEGGYSDVCAEVEKFLAHKHSEIKFAKFEFEKGDENILVSIERGGITSALYFDIDNDGKKEIIKKHSSTPPSTSLPQVIQTTIYYKSENDQKEKKYKNVGCFSTSGATELFSYKNKNYVFDIPYIIDNNYEISEFYKNNHLDNSNMEYLRLAQEKYIYEERNICTPAHIIILQHNNNEMKEICKFSLK